MDFKERELENYIVANLKTFTAQASDFWPLDDLDVTLLGRQVPCKYGIIDLLIQVGAMLWVVELKAVRADQKCVGQLRRYERAIAELNPYEVLDTAGEMEIYANSVEPITATVLVAPSFTPDAMCAVDWAIVTEKRDDAFVFKSVWHGPWSERNNDELQRVMTPYFEYLRDFRAEFLKREEQRILTDSAIRQASYTN